MKATRVTFPELALIAGTRAVAGAGLGLLLSNRLSERERRVVGWALLSDIPLLVQEQREILGLPPVEVGAC